MSERRLTIWAYGLVLRCEGIEKHAKNDLFAVYNADRGRGGIVRE
jgi:hypothetical protein